MEVKSNLNPGLAKPVLRSGFPSTPSNERTESVCDPLLAGMARISAGRFLLVDGLGSLLYGGCFLCLGYLFSNQIEQIGAAISQIGGSALSLMVVVAAIYIAGKYWQRQRLLRELRMARISVAEMCREQEAGEDVV